MASSTPQALIVVGIVLGLGLGAVPAGSASEDGGVDTVAYLNLSELTPTNCDGSAAPGYGISQACAAVRPGAALVTVTIADATGLKVVVSSWSKDSAGNVIGFETNRCNKGTFTFVPAAGAATVGVTFRLHSAPLTCSPQPVPGTTGTVTFAWN